MTAQTVEDSEKARAVASALLTGATLVGFCFDTGFSLRFSSNGLRYYGGAALPPEVELRIDAPWRVGSAEEWAAKVERFGSSTCAEREEPVLAFELGRLRWSTGSVVSAVEVAGGALRLVLEGGDVLEVPPLPKDDDEHWSVVEFGALESARNWSVVSDGGALFVRAPV